MKPFQTKYLSDNIDITPEDQKVILNYAVQYMRLLGKVRFTKIIKEDTLKQIARATH